jgi:hypothetical protein
MLAAGAIAAAGVATITIPLAIGWPLRQHV